MNTKTLKRTGATIALLAGMGAATPALATSTGAQALGVGSAVTGNTIDVFTFTCPVFLVGPVIGARVRVFDSGPVVAFNNLTVVVGEDGAPTVQATDLSPASFFFPVGDSLGSSAFVTAADGPGTYAMAFKKSGLGAEGYIGEAQCVRPFFFAPFNPALIRRINQ